MNRTLCIAVLAACASLAIASPVQPGQRFPGALVDIRAPLSEGWVVAAATSTTVAFVRRAPGSARSDVATVALFPAPEGLDRDGFLALVRRAVEAESPADRFRPVESSYEHSDERGYPCVVHRSLSDDLQAGGLAAGSAPPRLQMYALYCRHPQRAGLGFSAAYSSRGPAINAEVPEQGRGFADGITVPTR